MLKYSFNLIDDGLVGQQLFAGETTRLAYMTDEAVRRAATSSSRSASRTGRRTPGTTEASRLRSTARLGPPGPNGPARPGYGARMSTDKNLRKGDHVEWNSHGSTAGGTVGEGDHGGDRSGRPQGEGLRGRAQYLVESDKSGGEAVHKPDALRKRDA